MALSTNKVELRARLEEARAKLDTELALVSESDARLAVLKGEISVCDVVAYQIGWGELLLGWEAAEKKGLAAIMPSDGFKWNELGALAKSFYVTHRNQSLAELRGAFRRTVKRIDRMLESMSEHELFRLRQRKWAGEKWPIAKWVQVNTIAPYTSARTKVRARKRSTIR